MNKKIKNVISMLLVLISILVISPVASAATTSRASLTSNVTGKNTTTFYVNAKSKSTTKLAYSCTAGSFVTKTGGLKNRYGYFEVQIWGRNSTSEGWTYLSKTNIKNVSSTTLSMKGYTQYKVRVYAWNTVTIGSYIGGIYNSSNASWYTEPTCTFTAKSNVKSLAI